MNMKCNCGDEGRYQIIVHGEFFNRCGENGCLKEIARLVRTSGSAQSIKTDNTQALLVRIEELEVELAKYKEMAKMDSQVQRNLKERIKELEQALAEIQADAIGLMLRDKSVTGGQYITRENIFKYQQRLREQAK